MSAVVLSGFVAMFVAAAPTEQTKVRNVRQPAVIPLRDVIGVAAIPGLFAAGFGAEPAVAKCQREFL